MSRIAWQELIVIPHFDMLTPLLWISIPASDSVLVGSERVIISFKSIHYKHIVSSKSIHYEHIVSSMSI